MKKTKFVTTRNAAELARAIGLSPADAVEIELRCSLNDKIVHAVNHSGLTHTEVAKLAKTSRSRLTSILNRNTSGVSTDLMVRILATLGYRTKMTFTRTGRAA